MKILLIDGTADTSSKDIFDGYCAALKRANHEIYVYAANGRISVADGWLDYSYRRAKRAGQDVPRPTEMDALYWAGIWSIEMALRIMPEWVIVVSGMFFLKDTMTLLRKATWPHSKMAIMLTESPYADNEQVECVRLFDVVTTNELASVPIIRQWNPNTTYLQHAYDPERHRPDLEVDPDVPAHDVVFVGSGFKERIDLLAAVDWTGIDLGLYGSWQGLGSRSKLRQYVRGGTVDNGYAAQLYRRAKIGLNLHRSKLSNGVNLPPGMAKSLNARAYELAACGVFQISDWREELASVFDGQCATFVTPADLQNAARFWLAHDHDRQKFAATLPAIIAPHTYDARVAQLLEVLGERARAA